jgi:hypothetical protein
LTANSTKPFLSGNWRQAECPTSTYRSASIHTATLLFVHVTPPTGIKLYAVALLFHLQNASTAANIHTPQHSTTADNLDSSLSSAVAAAAEHLAAHGWAVVPGVLSKEECKQYEQGVWDWLGRLDDGIRCAAEAGVMLCNSI